MFVIRWRARMSDPHYLAARGKSRAGAKNGDCHQFAPRHDPRNKALSLKRIGWLYPIFPRAARRTELE